jgi:hypothetical protein
LLYTLQWSLSFLNQHLQLVYNLTLSSPSSHRCSKPIVNLHSHLLFIFCPLVCWVRIGYLLSLTRKLMSTSIHFHRFLITLDSTYKHLQHSYGNLGMLQHIHQI